MVRMRSDNVLAPDLLELPSELPCEARPASQAEPSPPAGPADVKPLWELEKQAIAEALHLCQGNIQQTASRLGIGRNTLYRKMGEYGLVLPNAYRRGARPVVLHDKAL